MSLRARVLSWSVRQTVRKKMVGPIDVAGMRRMLDARGVVPQGIACVAMRSGDVPGERVRRIAATRTATRLFYIHGGGFVAGSPRSHRRITGALANRGFDLFVVDYRLAPEHRFPAGLDDVARAWRAFAAGGPAVIAGDSAGANLALALMLQARDEGWPMPMAAALLSPPADMLGTGESFRTNERRDPMFEIEALRQFVALYLGESDPAQPLASPLYADLVGLPPLCIHVGESEVLRDDALRLAAKARAAGVPVALKVFRDVPHVWQWAERFVPEARQSLDEIASYLHRHGNVRTRAERVVGATGIEPVTPPV